MIWRVLRQLMLSLLNFCIASLHAKWTSMPTHCYSAPHKPTLTNYRGSKTPWPSLSIPATLTHQMHSKPCTGSLLSSTSTLKSPSYLAGLIQPYVPSRALRLHGQQLLAQPHVRTNIGSRAFRAAAPKI